MLIIAAGPSFCSSPMACYITFRVDVKQRLWPRRRECHTETHSLHVQKGLDLKLTRTDKGKIFAS